ncbi:MAG: hypothetical protein M1822_008408 [Bathelium mastoideum]|nr:MAG: hypothetical protein M1822_008408 [Bathelium mastoideum]
MNSSGGTSDTNDEELSHSSLNDQLLTPSLSPRLKQQDGGAKSFDQNRRNGIAHGTGNAQVSREGSLLETRAVHDLPLVDSMIGTEPHEANTDDAGVGRKRSISKIGSPVQGNNDGEKVLKLSPARMQELMSSPQSLPIRNAPAIEEELPDMDSPSIAAQDISFFKTRAASNSRSRVPLEEVQPSTKDASRPANVREAPNLASIKTTPGSSSSSRPGLNSRATTTPHLRRRQSSSKQIPSSVDQPKLQRTPPAPLNLDSDRYRSTNGPTSLRPSPMPDPDISPMPISLPLPPLSIPAYLQLELSSERPSPLYIYRSSSNDTPYESSRIKFERLVNFLLLPPELERVLVFGTLSCLDAFLYTFTVLPLRFFKAIGVLLQWFFNNLLREATDISRYICHGLGRMWRQRRKTTNAYETNIQDSTEIDEDSAMPSGPNTSRQRTASSRESTQTAAEIRRFVKGHRRTRSSPSALLPEHKADILKGLLVVISCIILNYFDASRMYHSIRGQAAIKLYVIYNVLEVFDRLFGALGQDVLECLFSESVLERGPDGRSKLLRPFWMFLLALVYNCVHATALFYQVVTLNVAVNSYSNALLTLLMSNQFVEIKSTVFKKIEKDNLFQMTCADVVERFQLWLMLTIIALRNIVEVGGLSINFGAPDLPAATNTTSGNATGSPFRNGGILPNSFMLIPQWSGQVLSPFLLVLGSEMLVDWIKHAYINKFNSTKPAVYGRFLDVLARDYYSNAFVNQNLTKRIGLPVLPLACLFIRASVQTYHMFLATHMPPPIPSTATSLSVESGAAESPATTAAIQHIDHIFRRALGRSSFGGGQAGASTFDWWSLDDVIALATMLMFFLAAFFVLLAFKLVLGMCLLVYARSRYKDMKKRENMVVGTQGRRLGGWGVTEVDDDKKRWIYQDDPAAAKVSKEREKRTKEQNARGEMELGKVSRYAMVAKRIW